MFLTQLKVQGLRDLPDFEANDLGRVIAIKGPSPASTALGDALQLVFSAFDPDLVPDLLARWGLLGPDEVPEIDGEPFLEQVVWSTAGSAKHLVADPRQRTVRVELSMQLDPPLFGALRHHAVREPRLVQALGDGGQLRLRVSALFTKSFDAMAVSIDELSVGTERFSTREKERAPWVPSFLAKLRGRFVRNAPRAPEAVAEEVYAAMTSMDQFDGYTAWQEAMPAQYGLVRAARGPGDGPVILSENRSLRRWGTAAHQRAGLAAAVFLRGADMVWAEGSDAWVDSQVEGDNSALEQVWRVSDSGALDPTPPEEPSEE